MDKLIKLLAKYVFLFFLGGMIYCMIELIYRGRTHVSMLFLGGMCFVLCGLMNEIIPWGMPLCAQMACGAIIVTLLEFVTGCIVNLWLNLGVWDYSNLPFNILGQICVPFTVIWFFLSGVAIVLDDYIRYWLFKEDKPSYRLF